MRYLSLISLLLISCRHSVADCSPDASGCYCPGNASDVATCEAIDPGFTAFCCIGHGGTELDCGQPAACVPKPGIHEPGASGANWCCPAE